MNICGAATIVKYGNGYREGFRLRCKSWGCPHCKPRRQKQLVAKAIGGKPDMFITLTLPSSWAKAPAEAVKVLSRAWRLIRKREARLRGRPAMPFLAVVERTKAGTPHLHIVARSAWLSQKWLSKAMDEIAEAPIVDVRRIDSAGRIAAYVSKYIAKDSAKVGTNKRYWCSRDYDLETFDKDHLDPGEFWSDPIKETIRTVARYLGENLRSSVTWISDDMFQIAIEDWEPPG